jgi:hypothetical protein
MPKPFDTPIAPGIGVRMGGVLDGRNNSLPSHEISEIRTVLKLSGERSFWPRPRGEAFKPANFCDSCIGLITSLQKWKDREEDDWDLNNLQVLWSVSMLRPDKEGNMNRLALSPVDVALLGISRGCHLCSLAIGSSRNTGQAPFNFVDWVTHRDWAKKMDLAVWNMYDKTRTKDADPRIGVRLCGLAFGEDLSSDLDADYEDAWSNMVMTTESEMKTLQGHRSSGVAPSSLGDPPEPPLGSSTGDLEALNLADWWLKRCLKDHRDCHLHSLMALFGSQITLSSVRQVLGDQLDRAPTRLLFVGSRDNPSLRLHITTAEYAFSTKYFCLSYCWGENPFLKLTEKNLASFLERIDFDELPATIKDAIHVTRFLGCEYIWVDSLCIIQDSRADWEAESVKMGSVYRNADLTIAALGAAESSEGCFMQRNPLCFRDCKVPGTDFVISNTVDGYQREHHVVGPAASPLQTRAWVIQEQLMAPRTLFFGSGGLYWQCIECEADEWFPAGVQAAWNGWYWEENLKRLFMRILLDGSRKKVWKLWETILERYTACYLPLSVARSGSDSLFAVRRRAIHQAPAPTTSSCNSSLV